MGLSQSMMIGVTGVQGHKVRFDTIGNNLANINTTAYKRTSQEFSNLFASTARSATGAQEGMGSINPITYGLGTVTSATTRMMESGSIESTGRKLDTAIDGNGFYVAHLGDQEFYTRDGSFYLYSETVDVDDSGQALAPKQLLVGDGLAVQGYMATDGVLPVGGTLEDLFIPFGQVKAGDATTTASFGGNLDSSVSVITPNTVPAGSWITNNGQELTVGHVETTPQIWDSGGVVTAASDLANLQYDDPANDWFDNLAAGDEIRIDFERGGKQELATFVYGDAGTTYIVGVNQEERLGSGRTLGEFMTFLTGGLGDDGAAGTMRTDGGAMGTVRLPGATLATDGYDAPAEHAGAYLRDDGGVMSLSIASNLGSNNAISNIEFNHEGQVIGDMFSRDVDYWDSSSGGSVRSGVTLYETVGDSVEEMPAWMHMDLVSRDSDSSTWRWVMETDDVNGTAAGDPDTAFASGILRFDDYGNVIEQYTYEDGGLALDFSEMTSVNLAGSELSILDQDGVKDGILDDFSIDPDGVITAHYNNGESIIHARLGMALIPNERGLNSAGSNLYVLSAASGEPEYNTDIDDDRFGSVRQYFLEGSNVQLDDEMLNVIQTQRGYQFNSKVITTSNELLETLLQLKR